MKHLLSVQQLTVEKIQDIFRNTELIENNWDKSLWVSPKIMISFFAEPSTRTRFSFEAAMIHLGGRIITAADASVSSSLAKGETLKDTFRTLSQYGDVIVCRHSNLKWIHDAEQWSSIPVINAGNGSGEHPTQALLDLYTIKKELGRLHDLKIMLCGDLYYGRTVHSLVHLLKLYGNTVYLCPSVRKTWPGKDIMFDLENECKKGLKSVNVTVEEAEALLPTMDIVYMTRNQSERNNWPNDSLHYLRITKKECDSMNLMTRILHPLPRGDEISEEVDSDHRAIYHERQIKNGLYIRAALLKMMI